MFEIFITVVKKNKIYVKYLISGVSGAAVNFSALYILTEFVKFHYLASAVMAYFASFAISFYLQKNWTFRNKNKEVVNQMVKYFLISGINLFLDTVALYWLVDYVGMWYMFAQVLVYGSLAIFSFLLYKFFVFREGVKEKIEIDIYD